MENLIKVIFDIWFESNLPGEGLLGIIIQKTKFKKNVELPISQIPDFIRKSDHNLKHQPLYELYQDGNNDIKLFLGTFSIGVVVSKYEKWEETLLPYIKEIIGIVQNNLPNATIQRIGLKHINFYESNIFKESNIKIMVNEKLKENEDVFLKISNSNSIPKNTLIVSNKTEIKEQTETMRGSVIDIVSYIDDADELTKRVNNLDDFLEFVELLHQKNNEIFYEVKNV